MLKGFSLKVVFSLLMMLLVLWCATFCASASEKHVYDDGDFLSDSEESELEGLLSSASTQSGAKILISCVSDDYYQGDWFCSENGFSTNDDIVLLIITTKYGIYYYDIYTYGNAYSNISNVEVDRILDAEDVYDNIKGGELYRGLCAYVPRAEKAYSGLLWGEISSLLTFGIFVAIITFSAVTIFIIHSYKKKQKSTTYPLDRYTKMDLVHSDDRFVRSSVSRVRINTSSGGGSRGGHSGGGGGHRGGR